MYVLFNSIYKTMYTLHTSEIFSVSYRHNHKLQNNINTTIPVLKKSEQLD